MKSWKTPTHNQVERAISLISQREHYRYFFDKLENPNWIAPFKKKGFFSNPPPVLRDESKGTIGFPPWPESRYLSRMASQAPNEVIEIILEIETENIRVQEDIVAAALSMPPNFSVRLVSKVTPWLKKAFTYPLLPEKLAGLVKHLIDGNEVEGGFKLAENLTVIRPDPRTEQKTSKSQEKERYRLPQEPISPFGSWEFKKILQNITLPLITSDGNRTISLLCDRLEDAINFSKRRDDEQAPEDYSYIWRGAIDSAEDRHNEDVNNILVTTLKEAAQEFLKRDVTALPSLISDLEARKWIIFHRLALYLLLHYGHSNFELVSQRLTQHSLFENRSFNREYRMLLRNCFQSLEEQDKNTILGWIKSGPDINAFVRFRKEYWGEDTSIEVQDKYKKTWQRDRLFPFFSDLSSSWRQLYDSLIQELGEPDSLESINMKSFTSYRGPTSPKTSDDLSQMSNTELLHFLQTWESPRDPFGPDPDGLSRQLSLLVATDTERFISDLHHFQELNEPTYIRGLLDGILEAKKEQQFEWQAVLEFSQWVVDKPVLIENRHMNKREADPDWSWTRQTIIRLISSGLQEGNNPIPFEYRKQVWAILSVLTEDFTNPNIEEEEKPSDLARDPIHQAINSTRGEAIRLVVSYSLWIRRHFESIPQGEQRLAKGFEEMPEAKKVLESHLNPDIDSSLAIRTVYGQWLPWLILLDSNWAKENLFKIFPREHTLKQYRYVAWQTYIAFCSPYDNVFDLIQEEYAWAIEELGGCEDNREKYGKPEKHLAQHLMAFYWRGKIDLANPPNVLPTFWQKASDIVCANFIEFGGRSLKNTDGEVPSDILERFKQLWEYRIGIIASSTPTISHPKELAAFGSWFVSKKFNVEWAIHQLLGVLRLTRKIERDHLVIEYLVETAVDIPRETIECVDLMLQGDEEGWHVYTWEKEIRAILTSVKQRGNLQTQQLADDLINKLGAKGYFSYKDLLEIPPSIS